MMTDSTLSGLREAANHAGPSAEECAEDITHP